MHLTYCCCFTHTSCSAQSSRDLRDCIHATIWLESLFQALYGLLQEEGGNEHAKELPTESGELVDVATGTGCCRQPEHAGCPHAHPSTPGQKQFTPQIWPLLCILVQELVQQNDGLSHPYDQKWLAPKYALQEAGQVCTMGVQTCLHAT